jgi:hypothetical protein
MTQRTDIYDDPNLQVLEVGTDLIPSFFLLNIYNQCDPQTNIYTIPDALAPLPLPHRCVITGDLNTHHSLWNSLVQEPKRADELITLIENRHWVLVSIPDEATYHFKNRMKSSILDYTLALPAMSEEVINWAIDTDQATGSDHEVIRFQVISTHPDAETPTPEPHLNWRKTDWPTFSNTLRSLSVETQPQWTQYRTIPTPAHLDAWAELLRDIIRQAATISTPALDITPRSKRWWTLEVTDARKTMTWARRWWKNTRSEADHDAY